MRPAGARVVRAVLVLTAAALLGGALPAAAGTYDVTACGAAAGGGAGAWTPRSTSRFLPAFAACAPGGRPGTRGLIVRNSPQRGPRRVPAGAEAAHVFVAPPGGAIVELAWAGFRLRRADLGGAGYEVGVRDDRGRWRDALCSGTRACVTRGAGGTVGLERVPRHTVPVGGARELAFVVRCRGRAGRGCSTRTTGSAESGYLLAALAATEVRVRVAETARPELGAVQGDLWRDGDLQGVRRVRVDATDPVGIRRVRLLVDGVPEASRTAACDPARAAPCPTPSRTELALDTRTLGDGPHDLVLEVTDAAGNTTQARRTVSVANAGAGADAGGGVGPWLLVGGLIALALLGLPTLLVLLAARRRRRRREEDIPAEALAVAARAYAPAVAAPAREPAPELPAPQHPRDALRARIATLRAEGLTLQAVADRLTEEGTPTLGGAERWTPSGVRYAARAPGAGSRREPA